MSETTNYGLHLTDSDTEKFRDWREQMNGTSDSNMIKIDTALGEKAASSVLIEAALLASAWAGTDSPFTQTIAVEGLTAAQNGTISVAHQASAEQRQAAREAMLSVTGQGDGTLTVSADGEMPETDIPVSIILLG